MKSLIGRLTYYRSDLDVFQEPCMNSVRDIRLKIQGSPYLWSLGLV